MNAGLSLYLVLALGMAWQGRLLGQLIAIAFFMVLGLYLLVQSREVAKPSTPHQDAIDALNFGVPLIPHVIGGFLIAISDRFIVSEMLGIADVGIYTVAFQLGMILKLFTDAFVKAYGPWLYARLQDQSENTKLVVVGATYFSCILFFVLAFFVNWLVGLIHVYIIGKDFYSAIDIVLPFLLGQSFKGMYFSVAGFYFFSSKTKYVSIISIVSGIFGVICTVSFVYKFGLIGAAYGFLVGNIFCFILAWYGSQRIWFMPWYLVKKSFVVFFKYIWSNSR